MTTDRPPLEARLRDALHDEAQDRPLPADFAATVAVNLPDRIPARPGLLRFVLPTMGIAAGVVVVAVYALFASGTRGPTSETGSPQGSAVAGSAAATPTVTEIALPITDNQAYVGDLAYDPSRDAIWFVGFDGPGHYVFRLDVTSAHIDKWPLPTGDYTGLYVQVKTDSAGVLWITDDYQVVRFDPDTHRATTHTFSLAVPGSLKGGTSSGTWVSAIFPTDDGVLVARHHVPWLTRLDATLREVGRIAVPPGDDGAEDIAVVGETLFLEQDELTSGRAGVDILDSSGRLLTSVPGPGGRLEVVGDRTLRHGRDARKDVDVMWVNRDGSRDPIGRGSFAWPDPRGGLTLFRHVAGLDEALQRVVNGNVVSQVPYKAEPICVQPHFGGGSCIPSFSVFGPSDVLTDKNGVTWYVTTNTRVVYRVQL